jgi:molecular chaperone GrpE
MSETHVDPASESAGQDAPRPEPSELETLRQDRDETHDRLLRLQAEFDNYRKRVERERRELHEHFAAELLGDFLPVLDDVERALEATRGAAEPALASHRQGLELIHKAFVDLLKRRQVAPIEAHGADFDPNVHQAVGQEVSDAHREGEVIEDMRRGYRLGDRLLRPSMVKVATRG